MESVNKKGIDRFVLPALMIGAVAYAAWSEGIRIAMMIAVAFICIYANGFVVHRVIFGKDSAYSHPTLRWCLSIAANSVLYFIVGLTPPLLLVWFPAIAGAVVARLYINR